MLSLIRFPVVDFSHFGHSPFFPLSFLNAQQIPMPRLRNSTMNQMPRSRPLAPFAGINNLTDRIENLCVNYPVYLFRLHRSFGYGVPALSILFYYMQALSRPAKQLKAT